MAFILCLSLSPEVRSEIERLPGQQVKETARGYEILDIAGEGAPMVGRVVVRDSEIWLDTEGGSLRLRGLLAHPRITGPGYKIWAIGDRRGDDLWLDRVGVLARPGLGI